MAIKIRCVKTKFDLQDLTEEGTYIAYASVFGNVDSDGDVIKPGAFKKTLKKTKGFIPLVWMHNPTDPVGKATGEEDDKGLLIKGEINLDSQRGQEVYSFMKQGVVGDHSFAFEPNMKKADRIEDDEGRLTGFEFGEVKLFEASPLTNGFAANPEAGLVALKWRSIHETPEVEVNIELDGDDIGSAVAAIDRGGIDSLAKAKDRADLIARINGLTSNVNQFCERR
jgi:HK97 family phage prohead protease